MDSVAPKKSRITILVLVVLYRRTPAESESLCSLLEILKTNRNLAKNFSIIVFDNSPQKQKIEIEHGFPVRYQHDPTNAGLATAYNFGLTRASDEQCEWMLLLDQDTALTYSFLTELISCSEALRVHPQVASIVPKLVVDGKIASPVAHFIDQLRHQYRRTNHAVSRKTSGLQEKRLVAYNSGAALKVSALKAIGGFPKEYWLDYLDHAVFHALFAQGYRMHVMNAEIEHDSSQARVADVPVWRQRNLILAQSYFVEKTGSVWDRLLNAIWLLRYSRILWIRHPDKRLWKEAALKALSIRGHTNLASGRRPHGD
jgi:GT2 family glycosyltransferase